jgi:predicted DsbA family dithiol-disulfide isomerase
MKDQQKMEVEIWSDVMCPFCYIGKRRFEKALKKLPEADQVNVTWKSFQLNPDMKTQPEKNIIEYLAEVKGWSVEQSKEMHANVTGMAKEEGLDYRFDKAVVANSFDAHRLLQMAKAHGKGNEAEELLFKYYFTEGKNIADHTFLAELGAELGLQKSDVEDMLSSNKYSEEVNHDIYESQQLGVRGVPFFVLNRKYGISGAQPTESFVGALEQSLGEWREQLKNVLS